MKVYITVVGLLSVILGTCIGKQDVCDLNHFVCQNGECIHQKNVCDDIVHCLDGEDESKELCKNITSVCWSWQSNCATNGRCTANTFQCDNGKCINIEDGCNRVNDCSDGSDEKRGLIGFKCVYKNGTDRCNLPTRLLNDGIVHCEHSLDEYDSNFEKDAFQCFDKSHNISIGQLCDGVVDCPDLSDECTCERKKRGRKNHAHICSHYCLPFNPHGAKNCTPKTISCEGDRREVELTKICDGIRDCNSGMDERYCTRNNDNFSEISCIGKIYGTENITAKVCDKIPECFDLSDECKCPGKPPPYCKLRSRLIKKSNYHIPCKTNAGNNYSFTTQDICNGIMSPCTPAIDGEEQGCYGRFYCNNHNDSRLSREYKSVAKSLNCDGFRQCTDGSDEDNCTGRYRCDEGRLPFSVPINFVADGVMDCEGGADECPVDLDKKFISSKEHMISHIFLQIWVWFVGFLVLFTNGFVIVTTVRQLLRSWRDANNVRKTNLLLITNLATADFIMGIYLITIAVMSKVYYGKYCYYDLSWRTSRTCSILGTLPVISSQVSIFMLVTVATVRMITLLNPFRARHFKVRWTILCIVVEWTIGLVIAYLPMSVWLIDTFTISAWVPSKFSRNSQLNLTKTIEFLSRLESYATNSTFNNSIDTWSEVEQFISYNGSVAGLFKGRLGYYSRHALCVPDFYLKKSEEGWQLPVTILIFNLFSFIYLPAIYYVIYRKTSKRRVETTVVDKSHEMQRKMFKIVVSDFICWMPICVIALLQTFGAIKSVSTVLYGITAIVILPTNSVLNPLLYTGTFERLWRRLNLMNLWMRKRLSEIKRKKLEENENSSEENTTQGEYIDMEVL